MRKFFPAVLFVVLAGLCSVSFAAATIDPGDVGSGARAIGMGRAFSAVGDDVSAMFNNPAGLAYVNSRQLTSMYVNLLNDIPYTAIGFAVPTDIGTFGLGYISSSIGGVITTALDSNGRPVDSGDRLGYQNSMVFLSYGKNLDLGGVKNVSFGLNTKVFSQGYTGVTGQNATGIDMDLGFLYKPKNYLTLSLLGKNILPSGNSALGALVWTGGAKDSIPSSLSVGAALKVFGDDAPAQFNGQQLVVATDLDIDVFSRKPTLAHLGVEWQPVKILSLRAGMDQDYAVGATNTNISNNATMGIGLNIGNVSFDYAYRNYFALAENSAQYISFTIRGF